MASETGMKIDKSIIAMVIGLVGAGGAGTSLIKGDGDHKALESRVHAMEITQATESNDHQEILFIKEKVNEMNIMLIKIQIRLERDDP